MQQKKNDIRNPDFSGNMVKLVEWIIPSVRNVGLVSDGKFIEVMTKKNCFLFTCC